MKTWIDLSTKLQKEADVIWKKAEADYQNAGHDDEGRTGDEGWVKVMQEFGKAKGLYEAANEINMTVKKLMGVK